MAARLRIGISPCPNDVFAFHALMAGEVAPDGLELDVALGDVQELNAGLLAGRFDAAKASFHAALRLARDVVVLRSGSALGFGVGPLLLAAPGRTHPAGPVRVQDGAPRPARVLAPGELTTATLLYRLFHRGEGELHQVVFSDVMPALVRGDADFGVVIHEGRFTYEGRGLRLVEDLGDTWERTTGAPLPLGGIVARRRLGHDAIERLQDAVRRSLEWALAHRDATLPAMRAHAQELDERVIRSHVDLYVNDWTLDLGVEGARALAELAARAREAGIVAADAPPLDVAG